MTHTQKLPACSRHIDKAKASDILYTLAKYASPKCLPDTDAAGFHSLLCAAGIISPDSPLPQKREEATCFQIISKYKCGHLCQMCDYSSRNKNRLETEESLLLAYALKGWSCFQYLKGQGLLPEHFHAVFLLNDMPSGKTVATLPLFRLAYSFLERMGSPALKFGDLPVMIASALDQNNPGKLLPQNVQAILEYLRRLQAGSRSMKQEKIAGVLLQVLHPEQEPAAPSQKEAEPAPVSCDFPEPSKEDCTAAECIDGLLGSVPSAPNKSNSRRKASATEPKTVDVDHSVPMPAVPIPAAPDSEKSECAAPCQNANVCPASSASSDHTSSAVCPPLGESLFLPAGFSVHDSERTGYPFHAIEENPADLQLLVYFLQFNPLIGMEIVADTDTGATMVLLCASNQFYYIPANTEQAVGIFRTYFSKSSVRRQICLDPYQVYCFLQKNNICCQNVYSLRSAYRVVSEAKGRTGIKKPMEMIKELVSKDNIYSYSPYIFTMLQYVRMYEVLSAHPLMQMQPQVKRLRTLSFVDMLLGISYELENVADTAGCLFELDEQLEFHFRYSPGVNMKDGILAVSFTFSAKKQVQQLVTELIACFSRKRLAQIFGFRLLKYSQDSITFAAPEKYYAQLCDAVANLATFLAEKMDLTPLEIIEKTYNGNRSKL